MDEEFSCNIELMEIINGWTEIPPRKESLWKRLIKLFHIERRK